MTPDCERFLAFVFRHATEDERGILGMRTGPDKGWRPMYYGAPRWQRSTFHHFSIGLQRPTTNGPWKDGGPSSKAANFTGGVAIVLDDIFEKVEPPALEPTYIIQTKPETEEHPKSEQWGYVLTEPLRDRKTFESMINGAIEEGLSDPGMNNPIRWARVPGSLTPGKIHRAELLRLDETRLFAPMDLVNGLRLYDWLRKPVTKTTSGPIDLGEAVHDPLMTWLNDNGHIHGQSAGGPYYKVQCPRGDEHSDGSPHGYYVPRHQRGGGFFHCKHGHKEHGRPDQREFLEWAHRQGAPTPLDMNALAKALDIYRERFK